MNSLIPPPTETDLNPVLETSPGSPPIVGQSAPSEEIKPVITGGPSDVNVTQHPIVNQQTEFQSGEQAEQIKPNRWDKWSAGWELLSEKSPVGIPGAESIGSLSRKWIERQTQDYS